MAIHLTTVGAAVQQAGVKLMVYGGSGAGKTRLCATAPNCVIISAEKGLLSLREVAPNAPVIEVTTYDQMYEAYLWATQAKEARQFQTLALDSASEIAEVVLNDLKAKTRDPRKAYGELGDTVTAMFRFFRDIPGKNVVFTAKSQMLTDGLSGAQSFGPWFPGKALVQALPYFFDELFELIVSKDQAGQEFRALRTRRDIQHEAKDRSGRLAEWEPADLTYVFNKIAGRV